MIPAGFDYAAPSTLGEALTLLKREGTMVLAGGQFLLTELKPRRRRPVGLIDLRQVPGLRAITRRADGGLTIGAMVTCAELAAHGDAKVGARALAEAAQGVGDVQVRHRATLGGNLACGHPAADLPAAVQALEGAIHVVGPDGLRVIESAQLGVAPFRTALRAGEIITEVHLPPLVAGSTSAYEKIGIPSSLYPLCGVAVSIVPRGGPASRAAGSVLVRCRVAVTGVTQYPMRLPAVEAALEGKAANAQSIAAAAKKTSTGLTFTSDLFGSAEYREHLTSVLTQRALTRAVELMLKPRA